MRIISSGLIFTIAVAASPFAQSQAPAETQPGFFKPSADPAITAIRPAPPVPAAAPSAPEAPDEMAALIREAEERQMDRVERDHAVAREQAARNATLPAITSPLDGTAPIRSPLDGTAPILSPVER